MRRHRNLRRSVGEAEAGRPHQILVGNHTDGNARQPAVEHLAFEPGAEEPFGALHVRIRGEVMR